MRKPYGGVILISRNSNEAHCNRAEKELVVRVYVTKIEISL